MTGRTDWLEAGLICLRDGGEAALTVEKLCAALGRTKGSFYHHFDDIAAYHEALLDLWADRHTEWPIQTAKRGSRVQQRRQLRAAVGKLDLRLERAVHAWALRSAATQKIAARVHQRRIAFLVSLGAKRGVAELEYAAFIGAMHVYPKAADKRRRILARLA